MISVAQYAKNHLNCNTIRLKLSSDETTSNPLDSFTGIECEDDNINDLCDLLFTMFRTQVLRQNNTVITLVSIHKLIHPIFVKYTSRYERKLTNRLIGCCSSKI